MEEDWGAQTTNATFTLFRKASPEEEAKKNTFVDIVVYNRWSKAERRLYQRLKAQHIAYQVEQAKIQSIDDITESLGQLTMFRKESPHEDSNIDDLIHTLESMKLRAEETKLFQIKS